MADTTGSTATVAPGAPPPRTSPPPARQGNRYQKWRARVIVLLMIVFAVLVGWTILRSQTARDAKLDLGDVTLTSQPIPVMTSLPGLVTAVDVEAGDRVNARQRLGEIEVTTTNSQGRPVLSRRVLVAPRAGIVVDDPLTLGATLQPGVAFLELYDPADLQLEADVPLSYLPEISPGMTAELRAQNMIRTVEAVVQRAVPRVGDGQDDVGKDRLRLVLVPKDPDLVARLIPGLRLTGTVDTRTGAGEEPKSVYVD